jgi:DNA polymerase III subunit beta
VNIVISRDDLFEGLQRVFSVVPQKPTLPVLTNFLISSVKSGIRIAGTDMDMAITTTVPCTVEGEGAVTVNAKRFLSIIRELPEGDVTIEVENERVTVSFASGRSSIMGMSADDYPAVRDDVEGVEVALSGEELFEMVEKTSFAVASERTRLTLTGVFMRIASDNITMVATDGHRLSMYEKSMDIGVKEVAEAIVPPKALIQAARIFSPEAELKRVVIGQGAIIIDFGSTVIFSKLIEGPYPDYRQVIPQGNSKVVHIDTAALEATVRRVSVLSSSITHQVRFSLTRGSMEVTTVNADIGGEARETVAVRYDGDPVTIGFNATFLSEILRKIGTEELMIELEAPTSACLVKPAAGDGYEQLYLIMPLRLNE